MDGETAIITEVKGNKLQDNDIDFRRLEQLCYSIPPEKKGGKTLEMSEVFTAQIALL